MNPKHREQSINRWWTAASSLLVVQLLWRWMVICFVNLWPEQLCRNINVKQTDNVRYEQNKWNKGWNHVKKEAERISVCWNLLHQRRRKHGTAIPPPANFIIHPSIKHGCRLHWRRRKGKGEDTRRGFRRRREEEEERGGEQGGF